MNTNVLAAVATTVVITGAGVLAFLPGTAMAATCSDFSNQADAQRAANTRDPNGNGIYCESLPCPCLGAGGSGGGGSSPTPTRPARVAGCGVERWAVKTLQDPAARLVNRKPRNMTIAQLGMASVQAGEGPRVSPFETTTYRVPAHLVSAKVEDDSDIHLVIADPATGGTMIAEIPSPSCASGAPSWAKAAWTKARATLATCGTVGTSWTDYPVGASATLTGVGFKDKMHGQTGVAPNGVELHPVSSITALRCG